MAAGSTYTPIASTTLATAATDYTFSSIPGTYTDLVIITSNLTCTGTYTLMARLNGDTSTNYSWTCLNGNGTSATSYRATNDNRGLCLGAYVNGMSATEPATAVSTILNYSNTTTYKTSISRYSLAGTETEADVSLWRSTSAITSITLRVSNASFNFKTGTTFALYGITAA